MLGRKINKHYKKITQDVLPCLIMTFYEAEDPKVASKMMEAIVRMFNQRTEFFDNLMKLEILFDDINKKIHKLL